MKNNKNTYSPVIILLEPQLEENIGGVARAMLNFNIHNLRIVKKKKWVPSKISLKMSAGADEILKKAKVFKNLKDAISDLQYVYATSNRKRDLNIKVVNLKKGIELINQYKNNKSGILFGPERSGLNNNDISLCDAIISVPVNRKFNSLNLSQCVLLIVYELFNLNSYKNNFANQKKAKKKELLIFFSVLESLLEKKFFFKVKEKRMTMIRNIRAIYNKANLTSKEIKITLGIIKNLAK